MKSFAARCHHVSKVVMDNSDCTTNHIKSNGRPLFFSRVCQGHFFRSAPPCHLDILPQRFFFFLPPLYICNIPCQQTCMCCISVDWQEDRCVCVFMSVYDLVWATELRKTDHYIPWQLLAERKSNLHILHCRGSMLMFTDGLRT